MREIKLSNGMATIVDDEDFEELNKYNWRVKKANNTYYARRCIKGITCKQIDVFMHRCIIDIPKGMFCDHINHNGLDNRKENLRAVTTRQNAQNLARKTSSIYPGVHFHKGKWISRIRVGSKRLYLGYFNTEQEAFGVYIAKLAELGETCLV